MVEVRGRDTRLAEEAKLDVLDLQHRLPLTWAVTRRGECEVWVARRVAKLSRHLPYDKIDVVDTAVSRMIATEAVGRVLEVAEAKIIEADTDLHERRREAERRRRYVGPGRTDEHGLRTLIAPRHPEAHPDELRALAFGWLARPAELFTLLLEHSPPESKSDLGSESESGPERDLSRTSTCASHGDHGREPPPGRTGSHNSGSHNSGPLGDATTAATPLHPENARIILDAPPGADIYSG